MTFSKGQSGNPSGRKRLAPEIKELFLKNTVRAFKRICQLIDSDDERVALKAAVYVVDRAYGKPTQSMDVSGETKTYVIALPVKTEMEGEEWQKEFNPTQKTLTQ
jgi:DUF2075 family protein